MAEIRCENVVDTDLWLDDSDAVVSAVSDVNRKIDEQSSELVELRERIAELEASESKKTFGGILYRIRGFFS